MMRSESRVTHMSSQMTGIEIVLFGIGENGGFLFRVAKNG
jgi:hypothetical protein